jgi:transcription elongation factor GreA
MQKEPMTADGFARVKVELARLKKEERPAVIRALSEARGHGDLSENAEYHAAKERQAIVEGRIGELEGKISRADVIDVAKLSGDDVMFGATVTLADDETGETSSYQLVGSEESDIKSGRLSISAPLARALIGKTVGEVVDVRAPKGERAYEIVKVEYL